MANVNLTLSADARLVKKAREVARRRGTSLNDLIRAHLRSLVGEPSREALAGELMRLLREQPGDSSARKFDRNALYDGRV